MPWNQEEATVTLREQDVQPTGLDDPNTMTTRYEAKSFSPITYIVNFVIKSLTITEWEIRKLRHDFSELITRAVQPALWLLVFGQVFERLHAIPTNGINYLDFMAPGILSQSVLFVAIFAGITTIWERDLGIIHKFIASPTPRAAMVMGKAISSGIRTLPQAVVIYLLALILGVKLDFNPLHLIGVLIFVMLGSACFSTFSLIIACILKTRDRVMGIGQVLTMPLFFASNAIYPITIMPGWLQFIAHINPLTYVVDGLRTLMVTNAPSIMGLGTDFGVLIVTTIVLITIGAFFYPRIVQ
jgi:ABC-2 type transport system permease protein